MNPSLLLPTLALGSLLLSCAAPDSTLLRTRPTPVSRAADSPLPLKVTLDTRTPFGGKKELPSQLAKPGETLRFEEVREFIYPKKYQPAIIAADGDTVTPATPVDFATKNTGFQVELTSRPQGDLVILEGSVTITDFQGFSKMGGEIGQPLVDRRGNLLTENKIVTPKFATYTTDIFVAVRPGKPCAVEISHPRKGARLILDLGAN